MCEERDRAMPWLKVCSLCGRKVWIEKEFTIPCFDNDDKLTIGAFDLCEDCSKMIAETVNRLEID